MAKMGRPTKYTPELLEKARNYLANYRAMGDLIPSIAGLAVETDVARETLHVWSNDKEKVEFSNIYRRLMAQQERDLLSGGLSGDMAPTVTKMVLTKHGYSEKVQNEVSGPEGNPIEIDQTWTVEVKEVK